MEKLHGKAKQATSVLVSGMLVASLCPTAALADDSATTEVEQGGTVQVEESFAGGGSLLEDTSEEVVVPEAAEDGISDEGIALLSDDETTDESSTPQAIDEEASTSPTQEQLNAALLKNADGISVTSADLSKWEIVSDVEGSHIKGSKGSTADEGSSIEITVNQDGYLIFNWWLEKATDWNDNFALYKGTSSWSSKDLSGGSSAAIKSTECIYQVSAGDVIKLKWYRSGSSENYANLANLRLASAETPVSATCDATKGSVSVKSSSKEVTTVAPNSSVTFTATPAAGYIFKGWKAYEGAPGDYIYETSSFTQSVSDIAISYYAEFAAAEFSGGNGTQESPFILSTVADIQNLSSYVSAGNTFVGCYFELSQDISLKSLDDFTIGNSSYYFKGNFDGKSHTISDLTSSKGLFFTACGTISNLTVSGSVTSTSNYAGMIVAKATSDSALTIENCTASGSVTSSSTYTGGIIGQFSINTTVKDCTSTAAITVTYNGNSTYVGGIAGAGSSTGKITGCTVSGAFDVANEGCVGGIVGSAEGATIDSNTVNADIISSKKNIGGIVGTFNGQDTVVTNNTYTGNIAGDTNVGGILGYGYASWSGTSSKVSNNTASGTVKATDASTGAAGGIVGYNERACTISDNAALQTSIAGATGYSARIVGNQGSKSTLSNNTAATRMLVNDSTIDYEDTGADTVNGKSDPSFDASNITVTNTELTYTGETLIPTVEVKVDDKTLAKDVDYTVTTPESSVVVGEYKIIVTPAGDYAGPAQEYTYTIAQADLTNATVALDATSFTYNGSARTPSATVTLNGKTVSTDDYEIAYADNTNAGTATVTITGKNNCKGTATTTFTINKAEIAASDVTGIESVYGYTGNEVSVALVVTVDGKTLVADQDYAVSFAGDRTNQGTFTVTVTPKGNYTGSAIVKTVTISAVVLSEDNVSVSATSRDYDGAEFKPSVTVKSGDKTLVAGTDYDVTYTGDCTNAGTYTLTVTPKGNYSGNPISKTITINAVALSLDDVTVAELSHVYNGASFKPVVTVKSGDKTLTEGVDYDLSYTGEGINVGTYTLAVTLKGNYTGAAIMQNYSVEAASIEQATVNASETATFKYDGATHTREIASVVLNGKTLVKDIDYMVTTIATKEPGTYTVSITGAGNYTGTIDEAATFTIEAPVAKDEATGISAPESELKELTDKILEEGSASSLDLAVSKIEEDSDDYKAIEETSNKALEEKCSTDEIEVLLTFSINLTKTNTETGETETVTNLGEGNALTLNIPVGEEYNGRMVYVTQIHEASEEKAPTVHGPIQVKDGSVTISVECFSDFALSVLSEDASNAIINADSSSDVINPDDSNDANISNPSDEVSEDLTTNANTDSAAAASTTTATATTTSSSISTSDGSSLTTTGDNTQTMAFGVTGAFAATIAALAAFFTRRRKDM